MLRVMSLNTHTYFQLIPKAKHITYICCALWIILASHAHAASHLTLMSSGLTPQPKQLNIIYALNHSKLPLKKTVSELYQLRGYALIWSDGKQYNDKAKQLLSSIQKASQYGLNPFDYDVELIESFLEATFIDEKLLSKSDIVFSHAYIKLAAHINHGKLNNIQTYLNQDNTLLATLNKAAEASSISELFNELQPNHSPYKNLIKALDFYTKLDVENETITLTERSYEFGDRSIEIPKIRQRLHQLGDLAANDLTSELYDESLMLGVSHFQIRHGLEADGILGKQTVRELNVPIWRRIQQLELNLARAQSLPDISNGKHLLVNIPAYKLYLYDNQQLAYTSNVVVGKKKHKTPTISSELTKIILSPYWNVPRSITKNEIIPEVQKDPHYLAKNNMRLISTNLQHTRFIDPYSIDWTNLNTSKIDFRVRQEPGQSNSLGNIKFIFPNRHSVYLHDTPARGLFALPRRAFSHGCIRLEDPFGLAETLLSSSTGWSKYDLLNISKQSKSKTLALEEPVPIHLTYMTAWADDQGIVNFRPDIYNRDAQVLASLYNASL